MLAVEKQLNIRARNAEKCAVGMTMKKMNEYGVTEMLYFFRAMYTVEDCE